MPKHIPTVHFKVQLDTSEEWFDKSYEINTISRTVNDLALEKLFDEYSNISNWKLIRVTYV